MSLYIYIYIIYPSDIESTKEVQKRLFFRKVYSFDAPKSLKPTLSNREYSSTPFDFPAPQMVWAARAAVAVHSLAWAIGLWGGNHSLGGSFHLKHSERNIQKYTKVAWIHWQSPIKLHFLILVLTIPILAALIPSLVGEHPIFIAQLQFCISYISYIQTSFLMKSSLQDGAPSR